jgi:hypothetical protein
MPSVSARAFDSYSRLYRAFGLAMMLGLCACGTRPLNDPYPQEDSSRSILYSTFQARPKHLDPATSYNENEGIITGQVYEPLLQYHFLKRPYELQALTASQVPEPRYHNASGQALPANAPAEAIARVVYRLSIKPGIRYQPHPAFARDADGDWRYHGEHASLPASFTSLADFPLTDTRELIAEDYVYEIKRLAHPALNSPIYGFISRYLPGLETLHASLVDALSKSKSKSKSWLDLRDFPLDGVRVVDRYTFEIELSEQYPQFVYWLAMSFFSPVPWEAERFYAQPGMADHNLSLDWYPVGTGPYMLVENNPNRRMVLVRNPNFDHETYPTEGMPEDAAAGLLKDAGKPLPFIDAIHFMLEKENIPEWSKFLQGYFDASPVAANGFDQAVRFAPDGSAELTPEMQSHHLQLSVATQAATSYIGFNMQDRIVGGLGAQARKLRQAISIAVDVEEMISIFGNGRGVPAQGPVPPGIFGYREGETGINPVVYEWRNGRAQRKPLAVAKALLAEAGYPEGRDPATGEALTLYFDAYAAEADAKPLYNWYRKQFAKLGLRLVIRMTDYNRFQDKMNHGNAQIYAWGWNADYPDPENFLFLLYSKNGKAEYHGENASNYSNPEFDRLFVAMRNLPPGPERQALIDQMLQIVREDAPWLWGQHPQSYALSHQWYGNRKPNLMARNTLKYRRIDPVLRAEARRDWNRPLWMPLVLVVAGVLAVGGLAWGSWRRAQKARIG